ncbi:glycosyltransferase [Paraburkholderia sp. GAS334]|uniref:glycosyltransferase n=1 Tax=Paraburkholderia sp. GAS334 TaxID=3035131 RepID=UPI003D21CFDF
MRIIYFCTSPRHGEHAGGVKVIYDHVRAMVELGVPAYVMHERSGYRYPWTDFPVPVIACSEVRSTDHIVIPEIKAAKLAPKLVAAGLRYSIFVQNGYYLSHRDGNFSDNDVDFAYEQAAYILSVSDDTSSLIRLHYPQLGPRVMRMTCTLDSGLFHASEAKEKLITYMPRKNGTHAAAVAFALHRYLPEGWSVRPIDGLSASGVAGVLRRSRVFLSFSGMEGLGLPPIEASLCGNYVIGYHGGGGKEYWTAPNFQSVEVGDVAGFIDRIVERLKSIDANPGLHELRDGMNGLCVQFSSENENVHLQAFIRRLETDLASIGEEKRIALTLQKHRKRAMLKKLPWVMRRTG